MKEKKNINLAYVAITICLISFSHGQACNQIALEEKEDYFNSLVELRLTSSNKVTEKEYQQAAIDYVKENELCYETLNLNKKSKDLNIDEGGVWLNSSSKLKYGEYNAFGNKWGKGTQFTGNGPGISGGTVSYSFIASGTSNAAESANANLAITSLPTYQSCFIAEIVNAFAAWSAVANIKFIQVSDNGLPLSTIGATGDIRIGSHTFDGPGGTLAHAFYPPPNGNSAAGDLHFDRNENWTCDSSGVDIGIVALHELGHSIGLGHELTNPAVMQPYYNPSLNGLLTDDINGAVSIYGHSIIHTSDNYAYMIPIIGLILSE